MTSLRNASLVLKTSDLTAGSTTVYGYCNANRSSMTWYNVNLRILLGDMFDDYKRFNLCLNTIATGIAPTITSSGLNNYIRVSGLPFINQTYNVKSTNNSGVTVLGAFYFTSGGAISQYYYSNNIATFDKNQELCNITIEYYDIANDVLANPSAAYPNQVFIFDIIGVDEKLN